MADSPGKPDLKPFFGVLDDGLRGLARSVQARSRKGPPDLPAVAPDSILAAGRWSDLTSAVISVLGASSPAAGGAAQILSAVYGLDSTETAMLRSIYDRVQLLREGPFRSGKLMLREAERVGPAAAQRYQEYLAKAQDRFYDAHGLAESVQERALVEFYIGVTGVLMGNRDDARHWLRQCYDSCLHLAATLAAEAKDIKVMTERNSRALTATSPWSMPYYVWPAKLRKVWKAERAGTALRSIEPFTNCAADLLNQVSGQEAVPRIYIQQAGPDSFEVKYTRGRMLE
jgi:hypothetical protein